MDPVVLPPQWSKIIRRTKEELQRQRRRRRRRRSSAAATFLTFPAFLSSSWVLLLLSASLLPFLPHAANTMASASPIPFASTPSVDPTPNLFRDIPDDSLLARTMTSQQGPRSGRDPYSVVAPGAEPLRLSHGTTTVALVCEGGVIAAVDSRASMGSFVGSRTTQKVIPVSDRILGTMAGGAADCSFWLRYLGMQANIFETRNGYPMPVATAARLLADTLMGQRGKGLSIGTMIMGYEGGGGGGSGDGSGEVGRGGKDGGEGQLYYVDSEGARVPGRYFSVGSGSTYAYSVLDQGYRPDMSLKEAVVLARRAVRHATYRDAFSGGFINVFLVNSSGWTKVAVDDAGFLDFRPSGHPGDGDEGTDPLVDDIEGQGAVAERQGGKADHRGEAQQAVANAEGAPETIDGSRRSDPWH